MADTKAQANGNVTVWAVPVTGIADYRSPTAAEINAGLDITDAMAWEGTTFPTANESNDIDDRSLRDAGNATSRGFAQFEFAPTFFRPYDVKDVASDYGKAFQMFKAPRVPVYIVTRVLQVAKGVHVDASAGEWISIFRFTTDAVTDDTEGEDSVKYSVSTLPQGEVEVYTQVKNAGPVVITVADTSLSVGQHSTSLATLGGKYATQTVRWSSSNTAVATVSQNGVVTGISAGTATITASHPAATGATVGVSVTVT
jgi:hypothetical protein